jgi:hypothetical protein
MQNQAGDSPYHLFLRSELPNPRGPFDYGFTKTNDVPASLRQFAGNLERRFYDWKKSNNNHVCFMVVCARDSKTNECFIVVILHESNIYEHVPCPDHEYDEFRQFIKGLPEYRKI